MKDGFRLVARIPYPTTQPASLLVSNEVATLDFLRSQGLPVPEVYGYSSSSDNAAETPYILLEMMTGTNLGDIWYELGEKARLEVVNRLVKIEAQLFSLDLPASGSFYYIKDLDEATPRVLFPSSEGSEGSHLCIGPDTTLALWYGRRANIEAPRGPCK